MEGYKYSMFNSVVSVSDKTDVVYNAYSNRFMLVRKGVVNNSLDAVANKPELLKNLVEGGFVVNDTIDEVEQVKALSKKVDCNEQVYNLTINPTLNCNFKCWYCYETKKPGLTMTSKVYENVQKLMQNIAFSCAALQLSFFGGEPLLGFRNLVKPLISYANDVCHANNTQLGISFTSNGYLITEEMVEFFKQNRVTNFQITLDGNKELHNQTRFPAEGADSYTQIVSNIKLLLENGIHVILRFNYTDKNIDSLKEVADDLEQLGLNHTPSLNIQFHQVWQNASVDISEKVEDVIAYFVAKGFDGSKPLYDNVRHSCYADKKNSALINYNGDVYKCTAVDFENIAREGYLADDGTIVWEHDSLNCRLNSKFKNAPCLKCRLLPICNGACTQKALAHLGQDYCVLAYDEEEKDRVILDKFNEYVKNAKS